MGSLGLFARDTDCEMCMCVLYYVPYPKMTGKLSFLFDVIRLCSFGQSPRLILSSLRSYLLW